MTNWEFISQAKALFEKHCISMGLHNASLAFSEEKCWGKAYFKEMLVDLNLNLLRRHPEELEETIVHEIAHLVTYKKVGNHNHRSSVWKNLMIDMGYKPKAGKKSFRKEAIIGVSL